MAVSGGVYPMDHAMGYSGEFMSSVFLYLLGFAIGGYPASTAPQRTNHHSWNARVQLTLVPRPQACKLVKLVKLLKAGVPESKRVFPVLATQKAIQS
ncbi:hypothetical protein N7471_009121 [Penicillium samsonianum]|uniref:uncharacterized protein n=1 Tax=Penicillium samsonianum TaxID=1882272 RepID=UPI002547FDF4|nr:uncharacterized protein N7471_009121 [Penicillium samsonianum]KAJ6127904.1 hypothetical protein N7471_009121 [Penicillium samsonianum]